RVAGYVLSDFAKADQDWLDDMMRGIAEGAPMLAADEGPKFLNAVAQRMAPARPEKPAPAGTEAPKQAPEPAPDTRNPLERLIDRFR
ncbi:MAG: aminoacyl-tRNA hydrolase, partial [Rhodobacterales bacterium]|nr:aminoacyl-tRNA hydrolase [Rhodobacterales bacterium]MDX5411535.1 aminoacyl-tRNA hydrolase [Rhodobacterales bacterium]